MRRRLLAWLTACLLLPIGAQAQTATAIFATGCFWCTEADFEKLDGVTSVESGYIGGHVDKPTYAAVSRGGTGHVEAVRVRYDPARIAYNRLLEHFWHSHDFLDGEGQFCDRGAHYAPAVFALTAGQQRLAEASKRTLETHLGQTVATRIRPATTFYPAEAYHQDYARRNPLRYRYYRTACKRDQRLQELAPRLPARPWLP